MTASVPTVAVTATASIPRLAVTANVPTLAVKIPKIPEPVLEDENLRLDFTPRTVPIVQPVSQVPAESQKSKATISAAIPLPIPSEIQVVEEPKIQKVLTSIPTIISEKQDENQIVAESQEPLKSGSGGFESPEGSEILETFQVQVEVHNPIPNVSSSINNEHPTPEDLFEKEIESLNMTATNPAASHLEIRQNVDIIKGGQQLLNVLDTPVTLTSKSEPTLGAVKGIRDQFEREDRLLSGSEDEEDDIDGDYVLLRVDRQSEETEESVLSNHVPAFKVVQAPSIFDPFSLPIFKTDDFLIMENESLISFNQQLQDDIVREEEEIEALIQQIQELTMAKMDE